MIKLFICEDQLMLRSALVNLLSLEDDLEVIASAGDGEASLKGILETKPDIAILDIEMPKMTGLEVAQNLRDSKSTSKIMILTTYSKQAYFEAAVAADVDAYLLKDSPTEELIRNIHSVYDGLTVYSPDLVKNMLTAEKNPLTDREMEILLMLQAGTSTSTIAEDLYITNGTVRNYISSILSKTAAQSRVEALNIAKKHGWI